MTTEEDVLALLQKIEADLVNLPKTLLLGANQIVIVTGLSDLSESLGMIQAGEFRSGNRLEIGSGFSGMRTAYPPMTYNLGATPALWNLVGVNADVLQFGVRASDGTLVAGGGAVVLSSSGISAIAGTIGGWTIGATTLTGGQVKLDSAGIINVGLVNGIIVDGANQNIRSASFAADSSGWRILSDGSAEFNNVNVRGEITAAVMTYNVIQAFAGSMGVMKSAGVVRDDVTVQVSTPFDITVQDPAVGHIAVFAVGDFLRMKLGWTDTWFLVNSVTDNTTYYTYNVTRQSGTSGNIIKAGSSLIDYGISNDGFLYMTADGTYSPYFAVKTHAGAPWTTTTEHLRLGNLNSWKWHAASDHYGIGIGSGVAGLSYDPTNGLDIRANNAALLTITNLGAATLVGYLRLSGASASLAIGATPPTSRTAGTGLWLDQIALSVLETNVERVRVGDLNGNWGYAAATWGMAIGQYAASKPNITIDPTNGLRIRSYSTDVLKFDVSGNAIISGKLLMNQAASAIAIGTTPPTSATAGTGIWIDRTGLYGLNASVQQAYINSIGEFLAGAGKVKINDDGIQITATTEKPDDVGGVASAIKWSNEVVISAYNSGTSSVLYIRSDGYAGYANGAILLTTNAPFATGGPYISLDGATNYLLLSGGGSVNISSGASAADRVQIYSFNGLQLNEIGSVVTPPASYGTIYAKTDSNLYFKNGASTEFKLNERWTYLESPLTSTAWDGDARSTTAKTVIDLSAVFGVPDNIKAVLLLVAVRDSASATTETYLILGPTISNFAGMGVEPHSVNDRMQRETVVVPCNADGDIYYQISASGASTFDVWIQIWGYYI